METKTLNNGTEVQLYYSNGLRHSNAVSLMMRLYADLIDAKLNTDSSVTFNNSSEILWVEHQGAPLGGICFYRQPELSQIYINFSFTDPAWRGQGINSICHYALEDIVRNAKLKYIVSLVHVDNHSRIRSCEKVGMHGDFYRMSKRV